MGPLLLPEIPLKGKKVLMRVDFNVPLSANGEIADDMRIRSALPSIEYVLQQGGSVILMSHLGRPKGKKDPKLSLRICAKRLSELLEIPVEFANDCIGSEVEKLSAALQPGEVLLLENLRFHKAEEDPSSDPTFAQKLSKLGDLFVNEAFASSHRKHSSVHAITRFFENKSCAGFLMDKEIAFLSALAQHPKRPFYAIIGGAKASTKIGVLEKLVEQVDGLFIGGAMAFTFLKALGHKIGNSLFEEDLVQSAKAVMKACEEKAVSFWLPVDFVIAQELDNSAETKVVSLKEGIPDGWMGLDIGPKTANDWSMAIEKCGTLFWNGPVGAFEVEPFAKGTFALAEKMACIQATTVIGGGDSIAAIRQLHLNENFTHISTGGGAALEYLEHGSLPGIETLSYHE